MLNWYAIENETNSTKTVIIKKHIEMNQILALNNTCEVYMPLNNLARANYMTGRK